VCNRAAILEQELELQAAYLSAFCSAFWRSSSMSMLPLASVLIATIFMPAMMAEAGFVPCADFGMMQICRQYQKLSGQGHLNEASEACAAYV
jgi:hypothetical protein